MKLTTKRNRRYFWRELFLYMIPMILIVGTVDVFCHFVQCPLHPEWSAPCEINWVLAIIYWFFLILSIIFAIISARMLRKIKKQIENNFLEATKQTEEINEKYIKTEKTLEYKNDKLLLDEVEIKRKSKPKKIIVEWDSALKSKAKTKKTSKRS